MIDTVRVLVYGGIGDGACDHYRLGMYVNHLARLGVELLPWTPRLRYPSRYGTRWFDAIHDGSASVELDDLADADVLVFSRWRNTSPSCSECGKDCRTQERLARHGTSSGHRSLSIDPLVRPLVTSLFGNQALRARCGILYDLDDDLFHQPRWVGHSAGLTRELDLVELMIRSADLVTVATPVLAGTTSRFAPRVHVVRNAIELEQYSSEPSSGSLSSGNSDHDVSPVEDQVRVLFYGAEVRTRDYEVCRAAVDDIASVEAHVRRIWLGATSPRVRSLVDEVHPYADTGGVFASRLASIRPQIGLAPLSQSEFAQAKSELHWLEYSAVGAATIATRCRPNGPYDVVRDGVDGFLAESPDEWRQHLANLVRSRALREQVAGRARERVVAEYTASARAVEWAAAYHWVASHAGIGMVPTQGARVEPPSAAS